MRSDYGPQRKLLSVHELRVNKRLQLGSDCWLTSAIPYAIGEKPLASPLLLVGRLGHGVPETDFEHVLELIDKQEDYDCEGQAAAFSGPLNFQELLPGSEVTI